MTQRISIERLGRLGDGVARMGDEPAHIPYALAGETVDIERDGRGWRLASVVDASPDRIEPVCRHFGSCGGCQLQHLERQAYLRFKRQLVIDALQRANIAAETAPTHQPGGDDETGSRRRAVFSFLRSGKGVVLGFSARGSNRIIDLAECPVLVPQIASRIADLRGLCATIAPRKGTSRLSVTATPEGLDAAVELSTPPPAKMVQAAINRAIALDIARLTINDEVVVELRRPNLLAGVAAVTPPPGGFVQAVAQAEQVMADLVCRHLASCSHVADLFSGHGAFALRLAVASQVHAVEADGAALAALDRAWREAGGTLKTVTHERRDLFRRPLLADELKRYDGVVFDPPRAGAEAQARELAKASSRKIAAISCNPVTLARDLRLLIDGGYRLVSVTPIDQFRYSAHVEVVALLER